MFHTYSEFIYLVEQVAHRWTWTRDSAGAIRATTLRGDELDPLGAAALAVCGVARLPSQWNRSRTTLGLSHETARAIVDATNLHEPYNAHVRADLARALGIREPWAPFFSIESYDIAARGFPHEFDRPLHGGATMLDTAPAGWRSPESATQQQRIAPASHASIGGGGTGRRDPVPCREKTFVVRRSKSLRYRLAGSGERQ